MAHDCVAPFQVWQVNGENNQNFQPEKNSCNPSACQLVLLLFKSFCFWPREPFFVVVVVFPIRNVCLFSGGWWLSTLEFYVAIHFISKPIHSSPIRNMENDFQFFFSKLKLTKNRPVVERQSLQVYTLLYLTLYQSNRPKKKIVHLSILCLKKWNERELRHI